MLKIKIRNDFMIQEILNSIDQIDDITTEYTVNAMNSMIDSYEKSTLILENYEGDDLSSFSIFQEGEIMDDVKKQGKGQSTLMKILSFIPRLIKAIFHKIKKAIGKGETPAAVNKELQKAPKEVKKALPILFDNKKDKKSKVSMIKKILIGAGTVGAAAIVGKNVMSKSKENSNDSSNAASKMTELFNKLKNVLKRKSETEKKLEEAKNENPPKTEVTPPKTMDPLQKETKQETPVNNPTSAAELKQQKKETPAKIKNVSDQDSNPPVKKVEKVTPRVSRKAPVNNNPTSVTELKQQKKESEQEIEELAEELFGLMSIHLADDELRAESQKILKEIGVTPVPRACGEFVDFLENDDLDNPYAYKLVADKLASIKDEGCDTLIHACTHFSLLDPQMRAVLGDINYVNCGTPTGEYLKKYFDENNLATNATDKGRVRIFTTGEVDGALRTMRWFKAEHDPVAHVDIK